MNNSLIVIPDFIPENDLARIIEIADTAKLSDSTQFGDSKEKYSPIKIDKRTGIVHKLTTLMVMEEDEVELFSLTRKSVSRIHETLQNSYGEEFYVEQNFGITVYEEGTSLPLHHDGNADAEVYGLRTPNGYPHRDISTVLYLNNAFEGGDLLFPSIGVSIRPVAGMLLMFPGTERFSHTVMTVTNGKRFIVPQFWAVKE